MPTGNIRPSEIDVRIKGENFINQMTVQSDLNDGEYIDGEIIRYDEEGNAKKVSFSTVTQDISGANAGFYVTGTLNKENNYTRATFIIKQGGTYEIVLNKRDASGNVISSYKEYKAFSYSKEYDSFDVPTTEDLNTTLETIALRGKGSVIEDLNSPMEVFKDFVTSFRRTFDPRFLFAILAIVLFLLDVAVRKFKFKWPHEIIRAYKEKKAKKNARR